MSRRRWILLGGVVVLIVIVVVLRGTATGDSPEHSSASDAGNGTSALRLYAESLGHATRAVEGDYTLPSTPALLFVFRPTEGFSNVESQQLDTWLRAGNVAVYATEERDPQLDSQFGLHLTSRTVEASAHAAAPVFGGVASLSGSSTALAFKPSPLQVPLLRNAAGDVMAVRTAVGSGQLIAMTDPLVLCNGYLRLADNGRFAADLIALAPNGGAVLFDEFHHGQIAGNAPTATAWVLTPWGAALALAVIVIVAGLAMRGRAFGPPIPLLQAGDRSSAEYAAAVGSLLHRTGARRVTLETLLAATRRTVAERVGLGSETPSGQLLETIAQRSPAAAAELTRAEAELPAALASEAAVLDMARRLHDLAYPLSTVENHKESA
ncbi:MAG: DUF4350 domain-containing protein [Chloroflexi bacterium]|nr:MAG: DUF4350 domain-containing protein [Chloroflexota bacterium]